MSNEAKRSRAGGNAGQLRMPARAPGLRRAEIIGGDPLALRDEHRPVKERFIEALSTYDFPTALHSSRVAEIACRLSRAAGFPQYVVEELTLAGYLHDLGKIDVPMEILTKPGRLDPEEWEIVKQHPETGATLLNEAHPEMNEVAEAILAHHERPDGLGYPRGARGEAIPASGRILAIADVYDAITTPRSYRPGTANTEQARQFLRAQRGRQFDGDLVDIFLGLENLPGPGTERDL